jgi:hypothetical protein
MSGTPGQIPEELHVLAGEYVLGALDAGEMRAVRQQATLIPMLATAIEGWERRLAPMTRAAGDRAGAGAGGRGPGGAAPFHRLGGTGGRAAALHGDAHARR